MLLGQFAHETALCLPDPWFVVVDWALVVDIIGQGEALALVEKRCALFVSFCVELQLVRTSQLG